MPNSVSRDDDNLCRIDGLKTNALRDVGAGLVAAIHPVDAVLAVTGRPGGTTVFRHPLSAASETPDL